MDKACQMEKIFGLIPYNIAEGTISRVTIVRGTFDYKTCMFRSNTFSPNAFIKKYVFVNSDI